MTYIVQYNDLANFNFAKLVKEPHRLGGFHYRRYRKYDNKITSANTFRDLDSFQEMRTASKFKMEFKYEDGKGI